MTLNAFKRISYLAAAAVLFVSMASPAAAVPIIDFNFIAPTAGTISYAGGATPLLGTTIVPDNVVGLGTPLNAGVIRTCFSCVLNFTTGIFTSSDATHWFFAPGGTITLVGGVDLNNDGDATDVGVDIPVGTTLLSGSFTGTPQVVDLGTGFKVDASGFTDIKNSQLAEFYGLTGGSTVYVGGLNLQFASTASTPNAFTSDPITSGDITNTPKVPLPASLLLVSAGLGGLALLRRRHASVRG